MNKQLSFDRLRYVDKLKSAGIPDAQARAFADAAKEAIQIRTIEPSVPPARGRDWSSIITGMIVGAALFAAGAAFIKILH